MEATEELNELAMLNVNDFRPGFLIMIRKYPLDLVGSLPHLSTDDTSRINQSLSVVYPLDCNSDGRRMSQWETGEFSTTALGTLYSNAGETSFSELAASCSPLHPAVF